MGIFDRFFKDDEKREKMFWNIISLESKVDDIIEISHHKPQVIFKHSNQCGTSFFAKRNLENIKKDTFENVDFYLIDVIQDRIVSRYLSEKIGLRHESPQLLILHEGRIIWHGSHHQVNEDNLKSAMYQALG